MDDVDSIARSISSAVNAQGDFLEPIQDTQTDESVDEPSTEEINNPAPIGISSRLKDILLIVAVTGISGYLSIRSTSPFSLFKVILPLHALMFYGISNSYLATRRLGLAVSATGTIMTTGLVVGLSSLLQFGGPDAHTKLFYKSLAYMLENVVIKRVTTMVTGNSDVVITAPGNSDIEKVGKWIRFMLTVGVTAGAGILTSVGANIFRALTAKKFN